MRKNLILALFVCVCICLCFSLTACTGSPTTSGAGNQSSTIIESVTDSSTNSTVDDSTIDSAIDSVVDSSVNSEQSSDNNDDSSIDEYVCDGCGKLLNVNEKHEICEYCGEFLCSGNHEKCGDQGGNDNVCNHTAEGLTPVGSEEVICGWVAFYAHYYCEVCEKYFYYDETSITFFVECGDCNGDKQNGYTCFNCQKLVRELCSHCQHCLTCCECNFEDLTTYCPACGELVSFYEGWDATCDHPGMYDYCQCGCGLTYRIEGNTYVIIENEDAIIPPLGHKSENGVPICVNCGYLYSEEVCVGCLNKEYMSGTCCFDYMSTYIIRPLVYGGQLRTLIGDTWVRLDFHYNENTKSASLYYKTKTIDNTNYTEIATITGSAKRVSDYVVEFTPTNAVISYKNHFDINYNGEVYNVEVDSNKISYFMFEDSYMSWDDNSNEGAHGKLFAYLDMPFEICDTCHGVQGVGNHGICDVDGCGKSLCEGHVHGECEHKNKVECNDAPCYIGFHFKCNDCGEFLMVFFNGNEEVYVVCEECKRLMEEMGGDSGSTEDGESGKEEGGDSGSTEGGESGSTEGGEMGGMGVNVIVNGEHIFVPYFNLIDLIYERFGDPANVKYIIYNGKYCENVEEILNWVMSEGDVIDIY